MTKIAYVLGFEHLQSFSKLFKTKPIFHLRSFGSHSIDTVFRIHERYLASIDNPIEQAREKQLHIPYRCQNYLELDEPARYSVV